MTTPKPRLPVSRTATGILLLCGVTVLIAAGAARATERPPHTAPTPAREVGGC